MEEVGTVQGRNGRPPVLACLSAYDEALVRELAGTDEVEIRLASGGGQRAELTGLVADADIVIADAARRYVLDAAAIDFMRRCRFIQQPAVGYDTVDVARAAERGIPVANAPGYNAAAVADWAVMAMLILLRDGVAADAVLRPNGPGWAAMPLGRELGGLTVGLVGMGSVARAVAGRVDAFGSTVIFTARGDRSVGDARQVGLAELLEIADVVSLHVPLVDGTRRMLGAREFAAMKDGAILVNSARGGLVDEDALVDGLRRGRPAAAALDVFDPEPLPAGSALRTLPNVFLTPHIAAGTWQARHRVRRMVAENLRRVLAGQQPLHIVNGVRGPVNGAGGPVG